METSNELFHSLRTRIKQDQSGLAYDYSQWFDTIYEIDEEYQDYPDIAKAYKRDLETDKGGRACNTLRDRILSFRVNPWVFGTEVIGRKILSSTTQRGVTFGTFTTFQKDFLRDLLDPQIPLMIVMCNRGGAKTWCAALAVACAEYCFPKYKVTILGGSEEQSLRLYDFYSKFMDSDLKHIVKGSIWKKHTEFVHGGWVTALPASQKCFDYKTEILTENGFKLFKDLKEGERVATLDKNGHFEWQKPTEKIQEEYSGPMFSFETNTFSMLVSPEHRLYATRNHSDKYEFIKPRDLPIGAKFKCSADWIGKDKEFFILPEYIIDYHNGYTKIKPSIEIPMEIWLEFLGYYLSEGNVHYGRHVRIRQYRGIHPKEYLKIKRCLDKMGMHYSHDGKTFTIFSTQLGHYLMKFGKSKDKYISKEFKELNKKYLRILLDALMLGDGWYDEKNGQYYFTSSKQLCDDIVEITQKLGIKTSTTIMEESIVKKTGYKRGSGYRIKIQREKNSYYTGSGKWIEYNGKIYCVNVPNSIILVRRNGKIHWSGNSVRGPRADMLIIDEACQADSDIINSAMPQAITATDLKIVMMSTPDVLSHMFIDWWNKASQMGFKQYHWDAYECPWIPDSNIKIFKNELYDTNKFRIEMLGLPGSYSGTVFDREDIDAAIVDELPEDLKLIEFSNGVDWGFKHPTVCSMSGIDENEVSWTIFSKDYKRAKEPFLYEYMAEDCKEYTARSYCDASHPFNINTFKDYCRPYGLSVTTIPFNKFKMMMITNMNSKLEHRKLKIYRMGKGCEKLLDQMYKYSYMEKSEKPQKGDDDHVDSEMLSLWGHRKTVQNVRRMMDNIDKYNIGKILDKGLEPTQQDMLFRRGGIFR